MIKTQEPAQGIMLQGDYGNSKNFKVECECASDDHAAHMWIELSKDNDIPMVEVSFYVTAWTPTCGGWREKLKAVYEILFKGSYKQEHHMLLNKQSALNFAAAIERTIKELENKNAR